MPVGEDVAARLQPRRWRWRRRAAAADGEGGWRVGLVISAARPLQV
jgi:hypothetical protein